MARPKKQVKFKEPVRIRTKPLSNGNRSIFLDVYWKGVRKYEYLKLYLVPELDAACRDRNNETMAVAERIKAERIRSPSGTPSKKVRCCLRSGSGSIARVASA